MQINPTFAFASGATSSDITQFEGAVNSVISYYDSLFTNNVTLNVVFAYGEQYQSSTSSGITFKAIPNASPTGSFDLGLSETPYNSQSYSTILNLLDTKTNSLEKTAYATLPSVANNPFSNETLWVSSAQQKALGLTPSASFAGYDGVIGIISNEELQSGGYSADWTPAAPSNGNQIFMVGTIEHELSEVMGRVSFDGTNAINNVPSYTIMDLFRYSAPGQRQVTDGNPSYFSIDNGNHVYDYWNNPALANGDLGDWAASGPNGVDPTGPDAYLNVSPAGQINGLSQADITLMDVLGWTTSVSPLPGYTVINYVPGSSSVVGTSSNDFIIAGAGTYTITGGGGLNTVAYMEPSTNASVTLETNGTILVSGAMGNQTLTNVQEVDFTDHSLIFNEHSTQDLLVYELYQAAFDRTPDKSGFLYWANVADTTNTTTTQFADAFIAAPEFTQKYGTNLSNTAFATALYANVLQRAPDAAGLNYWVTQLNDGMPRDQELIAFATSTENVNLIGPHIANGYWVV